MVKEFKPKTAETKLRNGDKAKISLKYKLKMRIGEMNVVVWLTDRFGISFLTGILRFMQFSGCKRKSGHIHGC